MRTVKFCSVVFGLYLSTDTTMSRLAVINKIHLVVRLRDTQTPPHSVLTVVDALAVIDCKARYWSTIPILPPPLPSAYCHDFWYEKSRMMWLPDGEKNLKICINSFGQNVRMWQTDWHRMTAQAALMHSIVRQKQSQKPWQSKRTLRGLHRRRTVNYWIWLQTRRALNGALVPPTKVFRRLTA